MWYSNLIGITPLSVYNGVFPLWAVGFVFFGFALWIFLKSLKSNKEVKHVSSEVTR